MGSVKVVVQLLWEVYMADPVMSNLPLRRVLECISEDPQTLHQITKTYLSNHPMEAWIRFSNALRRRVFKEEKQDDVFDALHELVMDGYVRQIPAKKHPTRGTALAKETMFYVILEKGREARSSVKKRRT